MTVPPRFPSLAPLSVVLALLLLLSALGIRGWGRARPRPLPPPHTELRLRSRRGSYARCCQRVNSFCHPDEPSTPRGVAPRSSSSTTSRKTGVSRQIELLPKDPRIRRGIQIEAIWIEGVGQIASAMLSDLSPEFYQVCLRSTGSGQGPFRALPICGRWGWRRRARLAGLL